MSTWRKTGRLTTQWGLCWNIAQRVNYLIIFFTLADSLKNSLASISASSWKASNTFTWTMYATGIWSQRIFFWMKTTISKLQILGFLPIWMGKMALDSLNLVLELKDTWHRKSTRRNLTLDQVLISFLQELSFSSCTLGTHLSIRQLNQIHTINYL